MQTQQICDVNLCNDVRRRELRPKSHLLYGEDTAAAVFLRWPQGGPTPYGYILQGVGSPWNYSAEL